MNHDLCLVQGWPLLDSNMLQDLAQFCAILIFFFIISIDINIKIVSFNPYNI